MVSENTITFQKREFRGSRFRCLLATSQPGRAVAEFLMALAPEGVTVSEDHLWAPRGFMEPNEAKLAETPTFLSQEQQDTLRNWWLANPGRANTPNWDIASKCDYKGTEGLILIEAKAHVGEFSDDRCGATNRENFNRIQKALQEANDAWNAIEPGFHLSADSKYQLSNRFAFAWKVASLGVPVVLIYLGFLNAHEMRGRVFARHSDWEECVKNGGEARVPKSVWGRTFKVDQTPLTVLIRSAQVDIQARCTGERPQ